MRQRQKVAKATGLLGAQNGAGPSCDGGSSCEDEEGSEEGEEGSGEEDWEEEGEEEEGVATEGEATEIVKGEVKEGEEKEGAVAGGVAGKATEKTKRKGHRATRENPTRRQAKKRRELSWFKVAPKRRRHGSEKCIGLSQRESQTRRQAKKRREIGWLKVAPKFYASLLYYYSTILCYYTFTLLYSSAWPSSWLTVAPFSLKLWPMSTHPGILGGMAPRLCALPSAAVAGWRPRAAPANPSSPALKKAMLGFSFRRGPAGGLGGDCRGCRCTGCLGGSAFFN